MPRRPNIINNFFDNHNFLKGEHSFISSKDSAPLPYHMDTAVTMVDESQNTEISAKFKDDGSEELSPNQKAAKAGGRRKQSKPSRVCFEAGVPKANGDSVPVEEPSLTIDEGAGRDEEAGVVSQEGVIEDQEAMVVACDNADPNDLSCALCNDSFPSQIELSEHMDRVHGDEQPMVEEHRENFPTKYHRLGSELLQGTKVINIEPQDDGDLMPEGEENSRDSNSTTGEGSGKNSRIFHQDAYCDICHREFCNKYFLKTHKANKHGIFDDIPSPIVGSMGSAFAPPIRHNGIPSMASSNGPPSMVPLPEPTILNVPMPTAPPQDKPTSLVVSKPSTPTSTQSVTPPTSRSPMTTPNRSEDTPTKKVAHDMEDYCEICQKHFCNKYYLKKHKHDVHGIVPDTPTNKRGRSSGVSNMSSASLVNPTTASSISIPPPLIPSTTMSTSLSNMSMSNMSMNSMNGMPNLTSMANLMFINPFAPPVAIIQAPGGMPQVLGTPPHSFPPPGLAPMASLAPVTMPPASYSETSPKNSMSSSSGSPKNMPLPNDALRGMGVLNADAYCELCRKEFCNKYFLKVHKANKHGIFTDDLFLPPPGGQFMLPFMPPGAGDMPAAFALEAAQVAHAQALAEAAAERAESKHHKEEEKSKDEKQRDDFCDICKREFGSKYSLRIHQISMHGAKLPDLEKDLGEVVKIKSEFPPLNFPGSDMGLYDMKTSMDGTGLPSTLFGTMVAAKMADRVMCDICNKEVCNKYFLKTHKMKVHGIDPNTLKELDVVKPKEESFEFKNTDGEKVLPEDAKRPADDELLKMGIDPEAYCEICRKEFCSKYFLKTHKLNIHGIKEKTEVLAPPTPPAPVPMSMPMPLPMPMPMPVISKPTVSPPRAPIPTSTSPNLPPMVSTSSMDTFSETGAEQRTWKWKEPVSTSRVLCEVCNKELCNKYFLKTHMLKRHGISLDIITGIASPAKVNMTGSPMKEGDSNSTDSYASSTKEVGSLVNREAPEAMDTSETVSAKTWHVPQDYTTKASSPSPPEATKTGKEADPSVKKCDYCGMFFGEMIALQLHILQDHKVQVPTKSMAEAKKSVVNGIEGMVEKKRRKNKYKKRIRNYLEKLNQNITGIGEKTKSAIVNHLQKNQTKRRFRCVHCKERFALRTQCTSHIRAQHGRHKEPVALRSKLAPSVQDCGSQVNLMNGQLLVNSDGQEGKLPISHAKTPFSVPDNAALIMQSFTVKPDGEEKNGAKFATAIVYLPVHETISEPMTLSFTLTPNAPSPAMSMEQAVE